MPGLVHLLGRGAGGQSFGGERHLAGHDETAGLFTAFGQALHEDQLIRALAGDFCTHGRTVACRPGAGNRPPDGGGRPGPAYMGGAYPFFGGDYRRGPRVTGSAWRSLPRIFVRMAGHLAPDALPDAPAGARPSPAVRCPQQTSLSSGPCRDGRPGLARSGKKLRENALPPGQGTCQSCVYGLLIWALMRKSRAEDDY